MQQPGTLIEGKYEILGKLREGGMGTIYRVRHRLLDEIRVVKVLKPAALADEEMKRRFVEEARTATRLKHPNICTIHDFALDEEGKAYLVMEFIDGVNLADLLKSRGPRGLGLSLDVAHQTLGALAYLHRKNVVHRDIAPDNLMLTRDERGLPLVKVIDLGIAKTLDTPGGMTSTGVFLGKLKYASPEQFGALPAGEKLDGRSDLYSLGVVLYEMLTGAYPFHGVSPSELLRAHLFDPPLPFSGTDRDGKVPPEVRGAVLKALQKKREDRFASAEEFDQDVVALQRRYSRPDDLDDTAQIISRLREAPGVSSDRTITPSAQDRLDRQFAAASTPHPTTPSPGTKGDERPIHLAAAGVTSGRAAEVDTQPLGRPRARPAWLVPVAVAAGVLAATAFVFFPLLRRAAPAPAPPPFAPTSPRATAGAAPTAAAERPTTAPPAAAPAEPTQTPEQAVAAEPTPAPAEGSRDSLRLRSRAEQARSRAASSRDRALQAHAPQQATALYDFGLDKQREGQDLLGRGEFAAAAAAFDSSRDSFDRAERWSRDHPAGRVTPSEVAAAAPPTPRPQPPASAAPTRIASAAEAPRGGDHASDEERIREVIRRYVKAQSTLDPELYAAIYPSVDKARVRAAFADLRSQTLEFEIQRIDLSPGGGAATVRGVEKRVAVPRVGSEQHLTANRVLFLERHGDAWVITKLGS